MVCPSFEYPLPSSLEWLHSSSSIFIILFSIILSCSLSKSPRCVTHGGLQVLSL
nr:MAG TPA: hypothetical protein [Caudoviricetes sp.]